MSKLQNAHQSALAHIVQNVGGEFFRASMSRNCVIHPLLHRVVGVRRRIHFL